LLLRLLGSLCLSGGVQLDLLGKEPFLFRISSGTLFSLGL
jgi:hypothetical protein